MSKSSPSLQWMRRHLKAPLTTLMLTSLSLWSVQVKGASLNWIGASGSWDTTTANWSGGTWNNSALDTAVFGGTAGTVSLTQPITAGGLFFQSSGYVIDGNTLTLTPAAGSNSPIIQVGAQGVFGHRATINSILAGNKGFTKSGNGTLVLTNNANSFSGDLAIKAGNLVVTNPAQLGTGTTAISITGISNTGNPGFSGSSLILAGPGTGAGMTLNREVSITGRGPGAANASGGLISVGNNTIAGNLVIASGASEGRVVATHGITSVTGGVNLGTGAGQIFYGNGNWVISGQVTGSEFATDRFVKSGNVVTTTLWLQNDNNNFAQALRIDSGTVRVGTNGALGINTSTQSVDLNNGTLEVRTDSPADFLNREVFVRDGTTGGIFVGRAVNSTSQLINQTVTFGQLRALNNNNTLNISGRNGYNISFVGLNGIIGTGGANNTTINNLSNGLLTLNGDVWNQNDGTARTLNIGGNGDTLITGSVLAPAAVSHNLSKTGTGTLTIGGNASTYKGLTTIGAGTLSINNVGALAQTSQINIGNATTTSGALTYTGGTATLAKNILLNTTTANVYINASGTGALTLTGTILNTVNGAHTLVLGGTNTDDNTVNTVIPVNTTPATVTSLQKIGAGTWVLNPTASNTFTGSTTVSGGTLKLQESASNFDILPDAAAVVFNVDAFSQAAGGTLEYKGADGNASTETVGALTMTAGGGNLRITPGVGGSAVLTFASLAAPSAGTSLNVIGADNSVILTGVATSTATTLPGNGHIYINGADFARSNGGSLVTPVYGTDAGFVTAGAALTAASHNLVSADTSTGALTVSSVKMSGNVNVVQTGLLTISTGGILQTGGTGTISGTGVTTGGGADVVVRVNGGTDQLTLAAPITSTTTGGLTKSGAGTLVLSGANNQSGTVSVNEGTLKMSGTGLLGATNIGLAVRQGATFDLNGVSVGTAASGTNSVNAFNGAGLITNSGATAASLRVGNNGGSGYFTGVIQDGAAPLSFVKAGAGTQSNSGINTYTGATVIAGGTLAVTSLANIGQASGIGRGNTADNAGSLIFNGGVLQYTGATGTIYQTTQTPSVSTDRLFTLAGNGTIDSSGSYGAPTLNRAANQATLIFNNSSPVAFSGTGTRTLTLQGDSTGDNQINLQLINNPNANEALSLTKTGGGLWILGNTNNTYTGTTSINGGALRAQDGTSLPTASNLFLNGGVFESTGTFSRGLGTGSGQFRFLPSGNAGFSSGESKLIVDWSGLGTPVWGTTANFLGTGSLVLNSGTSLADVEVQGDFSLGSGDGAAVSFPTVTTSNGGAGITITGGMTTAGLMVGQAVNIPGIPAGSIITSITGSTTFNVSQNATASATVAGTITAGNGVREIVVNDNGSTNLDFATVSGVISGTAGLGKSGSGPLILGDANTYSGKTIIRQETVFATSIGADGVTSSSFGTNVGGGIIELGNPGNSTTVNLMYVGPGEVTTRQINLTGTTGTRRIDSSGSGPLVLTNVQHTNVGSAISTGGHKALELRGTNTDANTITSILGDNGGSLRLIKSDGGVWVLTGANTYTGGTRVDGGSLGVASAGALGALSTATGLTAAASSNTTTVTLATGTTANIVAGMNVSGPALGYGDIVNSITNASSFVLNNARTLAAGSELVFGGLLISNGALFSTDPGGLVLSQPVIMNNNSATVFAGTNDITLNGNVYRISGGNDITISNNLEGAAKLTVNGNLVNWESGTSRTYNFRGYGDSAWNGVIQNPWTGAQTTSVNIAIDSDATFTLGGGSPNTYTGTTTLTNGILVLGKAGALGTGQFAFNGGTLRTTISGGANVTNQVAINATPPKVDGTESITFSGGVTMGASRNLQNELSGSAKLIISSGITNSAASTLTIYGSGNTEISGNVGTGTGAQGLQLSGSGTLLLTGANTSIGTLTATRSTITLSGTSGGSWNAGAVAFNPGATLTLDNSGGNNSAGRLNDTAASLVTGAGGTLNFISHSGGSTELAGALTLNSVQSYITMSGGAGTLTFASVNFANSGSSLDLGSITGLGTTNKVIFTAAPTLVPASTGIAPRIFIGGNDFATHGANGVVAFTNYNPTSATNLNLAAATDTINVNAGMTTASLTDNKTINALKISGSGLTVGGSASTRLTVTAAAILNTGGNNSLNVPELAFGANPAFIQVASGTTLTVNSSLTGTGAWSKALPGTLVLNAPSFISSTQNLLDGTLKLNGGLNTLFQNQQLNMNIGTILDLNGNSQYIAQLSSIGTLPNTAGTITSTNGAAVLLTNMAGSANFGGVIDGPLTFARVNGNTLTLSTAQTYTGPTVMMGGTLTLENDASLLTTPSIDLNYATLAVSNNSGLQTQNSNRIGDSIPIALRGGTLAVTGRISTAATEKFGVVTSDMGANTITANTGGGTITSLDLTFDSLVRNAGSTVNFTGSTLGQQGNSGRIFFTTPLSVVGNGALGAWAIANSNDYAAYNTALGVGIVGTGGFAGYSGTFASGNITELPGTQDTTRLLTGNTTTGMLKIAGNVTNNITFASNGTVLNLEYGGLLRSNNLFDTSIGTTAVRGVLTAGGTETSGTRELVVFNNATGNPTFGGGTINIGATVVTVSSTVGLRPGMTITNANFPAGTTVVSVDSNTQVTLSQPSTNATQQTNQTFTGGSYVSGATAVNSAEVTMNSTVGISPGMTLTGTGIPAGTYVVSVDSPTKVTLSQPATALGSGLTFTVGVSNMIVNSVIADNGLGNSVQMVKSGGGILNLSANNTYTGGTVINQGTVNLIGSGVVIPAGGITLTGGSLIMNTNAGQIHSSNAVTLNGSSTLTLVGANTLQSLAFNNNGGTTNPTVNTNGLLTLSGATPITVSSSNPLTVATIAGSVDLGSGTKTLNVPAIQVNGMTVSALSPTLNISAAILSPGASVTKIGAGVLQLGGASTFGGGFNLNNGAVLISGSSSPVGGGGAAFGPFGTGQVSVASGARLLVDGSRTIANDIDFAGTPVFDSTANTAWTLTLNGELTGLPNGAASVQINNPFMTVALLGTIPNIGSITSMSRTGLGTLIFNSTGYTGDFIARNLGTGLTSISLLNDGNAPNTGNSLPENINLGNVVFDPGTVGTIVVNRAGGSQNFGLAANKIIIPASINTVGAGLTVTNSNGYGLGLNQNFAITSGATYNVANATNSNVTQGFYLNGVLSGGGFNKTGAGTLVLGNSGNTFTGDINVQQGVVSISSNGAVGNAANIIRLNPTTGTSTLRITEDLVLTRTIQLSTASNLRAIEVVGGKTVELAAALDITAPTAALIKADNGTLIMSTANSNTWTGGLNINAGIVRVTNAAALGSTTNIISVQPGSAAFGAALQLAGGITVPNVISLQGTSNQLIGGVDFGGQLENFSGVNTTTGQIRADWDAVIGARSGSTLNINGGIHNTTTAAHALVFNSAGTINLNSSITSATATANQYFAIRKYGEGTLNITTAQTIIPTDAGTGIQVFGGTMNLTGAGTLTLGNTITANVLRGATLRVDDSVGSAISNRLGSRPLTLTGGNFVYVGNTAANSTETLGTPTFSRGYSTVTVTAQTGRQADLRFNAQANNPATAQNSGTPPTGASVLFRGTNLGTAVGAGVASIANSTTGFTFVGQTGAVGTANKGLLPWALVDITDTGTGISFATADTATAILRPLAANEYHTANAVAANNNIQLTSGITNQTAGININSLTISGNAGLNVSPYQTITSSSGGILVKTGSTSSITGGALTQINTSSPFNIWTLGDLTITSALVGGNGVSNGNIGFVKAGAGTLFLDSPVSAIPNISTGANTMSGQFVINQGIVKLKPNTVNTIQANNFLALNNGSLDLNGGSQQLLSLFTDGSVEGAGGTVINTGGTTASLVVNQDNAGRNWAGSIQGDVNFTRSGQNTLTMYSAQTYTGTTLINGGTTTLRDGATLANTSAIDINYATLTADNNTSTKNLGNRIADGASISLRGGTLTIQGRAQFASTETIGAVSVIEGFSVINPNVGGTGINSMDVTMASLSRPAGATGTLIVQGTNLGTIGNNSRVTVGTINGVSTASGSMGLTNNIVGGWAITNANEFLTYIPGIGLTSLTQTGAAQYDLINTLLNGQPNLNVRLTANTTVPAGGANINALSMSGSNISLSFANAADVLNITSGGLIGPNNNQTLGATLDSGRLTAGGLTPGALSDLYIYNRANTLTINSRIIDNPNGANKAVRAVFTPSGGAITLLNANNSYTGGTVVNGGTLNLSNANGSVVIPASTDPAQGLVINGGTVTMNNSSGQIASGMTVTLNGSSTLNYFGSNSIDRIVFNNNGGTGNPSVNSFSISSATGAGSTGVLTIGNGGIYATSSNVGTVSQVGGRVDFGTTAKTVTVDPISANGVTAVSPLLSGLSLHSVVGSTGGFIKAGNGVLQIGASIYTGDTVVNAGSIRTASTNGGSRFSRLILNSGTSLNLNGVNTTWGSLSGTGTIFSGTTAATLTVGFDDTDSTFSGQIARFNEGVMNGAALTKVGDGTLRMTSAQNLSTGSTGAITVNGGTLSYVDGGMGIVGINAGSAGTFNVNTGGVLLVDNQGTTAINHRLGLNTAGTLNLQGGKFQIKGSTTGATSETITTFNVLNGNGRVELVPGAGQSLSMTIGTLNTGNSTGSAVFAGLSSTAGSGLATLSITTPNVISGQGTGANGSTTMAVRHDILGDTNVNGLGTGFLVRDSVSGFYRPLASNELNTNPATWATTQNAGLSSTQSVTANRVANTLTISGTATLASGLDAAFGNYGPGGNLLTQSFTGATSTLVLAGATGNINIGSFTAGSGTTQYIHVVAGGTLNVNGVLGVGGTSGLVKADNGVLNLNNRAYYTGGNTTVNGTLHLNSGFDNTLAVVPTAGAATVTPLQLNSAGSTLNLGNRSQAVGTLTSVNPMPEQGGTVTNGGASIVTFTSTGGGTFAGQITGNVAFTRAGNNTTLLTNASTYAGETIVRGGTLQLRDSGAISSTAGLKLNYGTLNWDNSGLSRLGDLTPTRIQASNPVTMQGGNISINGGGSLDTLVNLNSVTVSGGANSVNVLPQVNMGSTVKLTIANLVRDPSNHSGVNFNGFTTNNTGGSGTLGGQGLVTNGNILINQLNGASFSSANLEDGLIGGWAVADGNAFATYSDTFGVMSMGAAYGGFAAVGFSGTDLSVATTSASNINEASNRTIAAGAKAINSLRLGPTATQNLTFSTGATLAVDVGIISNANVGITFTATDATNTMSGTGSDLYFYINQNTTAVQLAITGTAALVSNGPATLSLRPQFASNTYTGGTYVQAGTLNLQGATGRIAIPGDLNIVNGNVTMSTTPSQIATTSLVTFNAGTMTLANYTAATTQTLAGLVFNHEGGTVNPGLIYGTPTALSTIILSGSNPIRSTNNSLATTPTISTSAAALSALQFSDANPVITVSAGLAATGLNIAVPITQHASMTGPISKDGVGALALSAASTFTTGFNLNQGSLIFGAGSTGTAPSVTNGPVGTGTLTIADGTTILSDNTARTIGNAVTVNGNFTFGGIVAGNNVTLSGPVSLGAANRIIEVTSPAVTATISGALTGSGGLVKTGNGTLLLSSASNNLGGAGITVNGGILRNGVANAIPAASPLTVGVGAGYDLNGFNQALNEIYGNGFITVSNNASQTLTVGGTASSSSFSGVLTDNIGANTSSRLVLTKVGTGTLTLSGANTFNGATTVSAGALRIRNSSALGTVTGATTVASGAALELENDITVPAEALSVTGSGIGGAGVVRNISGNNTYGGAVTVTGASTFASDAGTLTFSAAAAITGTNQNLTFAGSGNITVAGNIATGTGTLTKTGNGLTILQGSANNYSGTTTVSGGILQIGTNAVTTAVSGTGAMNVQSGGTLAGTGTIRGNTTIAAGGILSPGDATGLLAVDRNGQLTINGTLSTVAGGTINGQIQLNLSNPTFSDSTFAAFLASSSTSVTALDYYNTLSQPQKDAWNAVPASGNHDYVSVSGALNLTHGSTGSPTIAVTTTRDYGYGDIFNLFDWNTLGIRDSGGVGSFSPGSADDLLLPTLGNGLSWDTSLFTTAGIIVVVPEPSRMLLILFSLMALAYRRRR